MEGEETRAALRRKITRAYREEGLAGVASRTFRLVRNRLLTTNCSIWFRRSLEYPADEISPSCSTPELHVELLIEDKSRLISWLRAHHEKHPWMALPDELAVAVECGHIFAAFVLNGRIVGYVKVGLDRVYVHDFRRTIRFPTGDCFVYDTFVLPDFRRRGIAYRGLIEAMGQLKRRGLLRIWCHIEGWNTGSLELFRRAGFQKVARVRFVRTLGFAFFVRDSIFPSRGVESLFSAGREAGDRAAKGR